MDRKQDYLEIKFIFPPWVFALLFMAMISGYFMTTISNIFLLRQRIDQDAKFMAKVQEIQNENAALRDALAANKQ